MKLRPLPLLTAAVTLAVSFVLVDRLSSQTPTATPLTLLSKDGRRALAVTRVNDQEFVALDDLAAIFQLAVREDALGAITVSHKGKTIVLTPDQVLASVNGRLVSLPAAPTRVNRRMMVPVEFISRALAPIYDTRLDFRKPSHLLVIGDLRVPRVTVRYDLVGSGGRLTIDATPRASSTITQDNDHLMIKFDADALDVGNPPLPAPGPQGLVQTVRVVDATTLAVDLAARVSGFRASTQPIDTTTRLEIDVATPQSDQAPPPVQTAAPPPDLPPALAQTVPAIRTIAVDPGHGGGDEGVKGEGGIKEKDLVLAVARRIKAAIEGRLGIRVLLTRDEDRDLPIDDRTAIANNNKADLFISLHANASLRSAAIGASIYYAAFDKDADASGQDALRPERVPTFGGGLRDIELVAWDLAQIRHLDQSTAFASILQQQFQDRVPLAAHPVDRAPLRVLESANMPAVLIEMGFLTNADQEKQLAGGEFQNALTQALLDAVVKFRDSLPAGAIR